MLVGCWLNFIWHFHELYAHHWQTIREPLRELWITTLMLDMVVMFRLTHKYRFLEYSWGGIRQFHSVMEFKMVIEIII